MPGSIIVKMTSRREFLQTSSLFAALGAVAPAKQLQTIGVQLYTVRTVLPQKPAETLKAIHDIGYREVEATYAGLDKIWPDSPEMMLFSEWSQSARSATKRIEGPSRCVVCLMVVEEPLISTGPMLK